jgi:8-oxo-dGTP diphosphatase
MNNPAERAETTGKGFTYDYERPALTTDMVVFDDAEGTKVLLITRGGEPYKGFLALPGGYVNIGLGETTLEAAIRELKEETNMDAHPSMVFPVGFYDDPNRNPSGRVVNMAFWCYNPVYGDYMRDKEIKAGDDAIGLAWYPISDINRLPIAFDHKKIIMDAYRQYIGYRPV